MIGAVLGALLAYAVASGNPDGVVRRLYLAGSGVLAQFGGVTLAFAFLAAIGPTSGFYFHAPWFYDFPWGIAVIYCYFQIPLMTLVFLPAIDGLRAQWREAAESLGGSTWQYWRHVGAPLLAPAFLGATLLLFANALSAFATIEAWEDQISYVVPQSISTSLISEVGLANVHEGDALAFGMIVLVVIVMSGYFLLQRRAARWQRLNQPLGDLAADLTGPAAARRPSGLRASQRRRLNIFRYVAFTVFGLFFLLPLLAMVRFSLEGTTPGSWSVAAWTQIVSYPGPPPLLSSIEITLELAVITSAVMLLLVVPTMIWVQLRVQWFSRILEFICLLPLTIPAIVLVVGLAPIYNQIERYNVSALMLFWAYVILALPYAYRALAAGLAAVDARTLSEAARSLGARWPVVIFRVIVPNMVQAILNALLLTVALVLGEFTVAYLLSYVNLQTNLFEISRSSENAGVLFSASAATLAFAFILLMILSYAGRRLRRGRP